VKVLILQGNDRMKLINIVNRRERLLRNLILGLCFVSLLLIPCAIAAVLEDDFNDNTVNSSIWKVTQAGGPQTVETNQQIEITFPPGSSGGQFTAGLNSNCTLHGDFDIQVDYRLIEWPTSNGVRIGILFGSNAMERVSNASNEFRGEVYATDFGGPLQIIPTGDNTGKLRLVRQGSAFTGYYYNGGMWIPVGTGPAPTSDGSYGIASWSHDNIFSDSEVKLAFDNFVMNSGDLICPKLTIEVAGIMPSEGFAESGEHTYTVEGSDFQSGATVSLEKEGVPPILGTNVEFNSASVLFVNFSFTTDRVGLYDIVVRNPDGGVGRLNEGFRVRPVPVVLVHGWRGNPSVWNILKTDLLAIGYSEDDILVFNYEPGLEEPIGYATNLAAAVSNWRTNNGNYDGKIDIICHSYGAIVSRWYMEQMTDSEGNLNGKNVRLWVGLAPVNQGAAIADIQPAITPLVWLNRLFNVHFFGIEPAITHMKTTSATVKKLKSSYPIPGVTYKVIVGYNAATTPAQRVQYPGHGGYTLEKKANGFYRFTQLGDGVVANAQSGLLNAGIDYMPGLTHTNIHNDQGVCSKVIMYLKNPSESSSNTVPTITKERDQNLAPLLSFGNHGNFVGGWMYPIKVDSSVSEMVATSAGETTSPNTKLYDPNGIQVTSGSNTEIAVNDIGEYYDILSPQTGSWNLQSYGTTDTFDRLVFVDSSIQLGSSGGIEDISLGHTVKIASTLNQNGEPNLSILQLANTNGVQIRDVSSSSITGEWNVTAMIQPLDMTMVQITLYDDGLHNDGAANDGEYANVYVPSHIGLYSVETTAQSITDPMLERSTLASFSVIEPNIVQIPGGVGIPTDPDSDGLYEDLNANNRKDFNDVVLMFNQMQWIAANESVSAFDFNGNGRIDFNDIVKLFGEI
jgi:PKD repeat protein